MSTQAGDGGGERRTITHVGDVARPRDLEASYPRAPRLLPQSAGCVFPVSGVDISLGKQALRGL